MNRRVLAGRWTTAFVSLALITVALEPPAAAQTAGPSPAAVDALVSDIKAFLQRCGNLDPSQTDAVQKCTSDHAALVTRQQKLGVSNKTVVDKLTAGVATRGWRDPWP